MPTSNQLLQTYPDKAARLLLKARGFKSTYITTNKARHHVYRGQGSGTMPPVVFLHGGSDSAATFMPIMLQMQKHAREVIAVEAAGHGLSDDPDGLYALAHHYSSMNAVLDKVINPNAPAIMVGNSLGALTAIHYANHRPANVQAMFLISPMGAKMEQEQLDELRQAFSPKDLKEARAFAKRVHPSISSLRAHLVAPITLSWLRRQAIVDLVQHTTVNDGASPAQLQRLTMPIRIVAGADDKIMTPGAVEYFRANLVPSTIILQPKGMGHCPHHDQPGIITKMILDFIKTIA